jgi:hypothetical protein
MLIRQTIDIDLSKQPEELVAWAMDLDGNWFGFTHADLNIGGSIWTDPIGQSHVLFPSQYPTFKGDWKDSLLVRPEAWGK